MSFRIKERLLNPSDILIEPLRVIRIRGHTDTVVIDIYHGITDDTGFDISEQPLECH